MQQHRAHLRDSDKTELQPPALTLSPEAMIRSCSQSSEVKVMRLLYHRVNYWELITCDLEWGLAR